MTGARKGLNRGTTWPGTHGLDPSLFHVLIVCLTHRRRVRNLLRPLIQIHSICGWSKISVLCFQEGTGLIGRKWSTCLATSSGGCLSLMPVSTGWWKVFNIYWYFQIDLTVIVWIERLSKHVTHGCFTLTWYCAGGGGNSRRDQFFHWVELALQKWVIGGCLATHRSCSWKVCLKFIAWVDTNRKASSCLTWPDCLLRFRPASSSTTLVGFLNLYYFTTFYCCKEWHKEFIKDENSISSCTVAARGEKGREGCEI